MFVKQMKIAHIIVGDVTIKIQDRKWLSKGEEFTMYLEGLAIHAASKLPKMYEEHGVQIPFIMFCVFTFL